MTLREHLHEVIDSMSEQELVAAQHFLERLREPTSDPVLQSLLHAPLDDEPEGEQEAEAVQEAREDIAAGRVLTHAEVRRLLSQSP